MDVSALLEAGLTEGEVKVYLALLELGSETTGPIIEKSGIARSIVYFILDKLIKKGLVSKITKEKTTYFQAAEPTKILQYLKERELAMKELGENMQRELIPKLLLKQSLAKKSEVVMYQGYKGIRTAHEHLYQKLKRGEEYCYLGVPSFQPKEQHVYWQKDHQVRMKRGITCRLLFNRDTDPEIVKNRNVFKGIDARYMPHGIKTPSTFLIYKDTTVIILQSPEAIAVEMVNQSITDSFKAYFEEFWKKSNSVG